MVSEASGFRPWFCHFLAVWYWASYFRMPLFPHLHKMILFLTGPGFFFLFFPLSTFILILSFWESLCLLILLPVSPSPSNHGSYGTAPLTFIEITDYPALRVHHERAKGEVQVPPTTLKLRWRASLGYELHLEELGLQYPMEINLTNDR